MIFFSRLCVFDEMKKLLGESLALYPPDGWHALIDPGDVPFISSGFIYFL
jgi:hypothetical protein